MCNGFRKCDVMLIMVSIKQLAKQWYLKVERDGVWACREKMSRLMRFISVSNRNWILRVGRICCQVTSLVCRFPACSRMDANSQLGSRKSCLFYYYLSEFKSFFLMSWFVLLSVLFVFVTRSSAMTEKEHWLPHYLFMSIDLSQYIEPLEVCLDQKQQALTIPYICNSMTVTPNTAKL